MTLPSGLAPNGAPFEPGTRWALYRSLISGYMDRWIIRTPWFQIRLHRFLSDDRERHLHDHPFAFRSIILRGGYTEERRKHAEACVIDSPALDVPIWCESEFSPVVTTTYRAGDVVRMDTHDVHRIRDVLPGTTTLVLGSKVSKSWGFLVDNKMVAWRTYFGIKK